VLDEEAVIEGKHERVETIYLRHLIDNDGPEFRPMEVGEVAEGAPRDQQNLSVIIGIPEVGVSEVMIRAETPSRWSSPRVCFRRSFEGATYRKF